LPIHKTLGFKRADKRRKYLDEFAKSNKFDPLDADKWYTVSNRDIAQAVSFLEILAFYLTLFYFKGGNKVLLFYDRSHINALIALYPELKLNRGNFTKFKG
jgi:hypothetical protein